MTEPERDPKTGPSAPAELPKPSRPPPTDAPGGDGVVRHPPAPAIPAVIGEPPKPLTVVA